MTARLSEAALAKAAHVAVAGKLKKSWSSKPSNQTRREARADELSEAGSQSGVSVSRVQHA